MKMINNSIKHNYSGWMGFVGFILIIIYFTMFTMVTFSVENLTGEKLIDSGYLYGETGKNDLKCNNPKYHLTGDNFSQKEQQTGDLSVLACSETSGMYSEDRCEDIKGCSWENVTSSRYLWFGSETQSICTGNVNFTYYEMEPVLTSRFWLGPVFEYDPEGDLNDGYPYYRTINMDLYEETGKTSIESVCNHPALDESRTLCEDIFMCTWGDYSQGGGDVPDSKKGLISKGVNFIKQTWNIFTFQYDFGFEDKPLLSFLLNFIFVGLPIAMLVIFTVMMVQNLPFL